ncbi:acetate and sugar kinases/Hsc70/actin family protein [Subtercola endophyticus]|uniref:hypothetical protein n=1 Tax=Subtercola endophyticus TaxID=2895559 RepID=UPI001E63A2FF|nr:hypothetical protein [Subtercola endophyticus]UFS59500.1 hypothetical protein LQ955_01480 [Subtercola endophyticus]
MSDIALPNQPVPASQGTVVEQTRAAAEVAAAVSVARQFPRSQVEATDAMRELCSRLAVAQRAFYAVPNRGAGMSVHIARELARIWQNIDYGVRELARDDALGTSEMTVWCWDVESNVRSVRSFIQPHERMKAGKRQALTDLSDIYLNNQNTGARAVREVIFTVLPGWFLAEAEAVLRRTLEQGDGKPLDVRQKEAVGAFTRLGVTPTQIETKFGKPQSRLQPAELAELARIYTSISQDGIPATEFFPDQTVVIPPSTKAVPPPADDYDLIADAEYKAAVERGEVTPDA